MTLHKDTMKMTFKQMMKDELEKKGVNTLILEASALLIVTAASCVLMFLVAGLQQNNF
jgi:hypothetical protein